MKEEIDNNDEILNFVNEIKEEDITIEEIKKDYPDKIEKLKEVLLTYLGKNDFKLFKAEFPGSEWKYLT